MIKYAAKMSNLWYLRYQQNEQYIDSWSFISRQY